MWSTDLTYIRLARGFAYLVAIIDWYSRRVLAWRVSNSMDASFCVDCLEDALRHHGRPEAFTSDAFTGVLKRECVQVGSAAPGFTKYRTTATDTTGYAGQYTVTGGVATAWIAPGSVNTFVSQ